MKNFYVTEAGTGYKDELVIRQLDPALCAETPNDCLYEAPSAGRAGMVHEVYFTDLNEARNYVQHAARDMLSDKENALSELRKNAKGDIIMHLLSGKVSTNNLVPRRERILEAVTTHNKLSTEDLEWLKEKL